MKRILFFGGRNYRNIGAVRVACVRVLDKHGPFVLVHGACRGVDSFAAAWALETNRAFDAGIIIEPHPANWRPQGPRGPVDYTAGPRRNAEMADSGLDGAVGFPGGAGTRSMAAMLSGRGVPTWWPQGGEPREGK